MNRIIKKNNTAHTGENGKRLIASGYTTNTNPGPASATSLISLFDIFAIWPKTENITNADMRQVPSLKSDKINVSLLNLNKWILEKFKDLKK